MDGYKELISYQLTRVGFDLTWEIAPVLYPDYEDSRQRSQLKQAARSNKQNIAEGSEERSLSSKLKLYDVSRSSISELKEDIEDFMRHNSVSVWKKTDYRLRKLQREIESYNPQRSGSSDSSRPSSEEVTTVGQVLEALGMRRNRGKRRTRKKPKLSPQELEAVLNYLRDVLIRAGYLVDQQINALEKKHQTEGGYTEKLYRKRKDYRGY